MTVAARLAALRSEMKKKEVDAYIIGTADPHQSEYPPPYWEGRAWISGFLGSAGTVIVTQSHAGLWTDSRYFLQADHELKDSGFVLHKLLVQSQAEYLDWLVENLPTGSKIACDFWCFSLSQIESFDKILSVNNLKLIDSGDLLSPIWQNRPELSLSPVYEHKLEFAGKSRTEKLTSIRIEMEGKEANYLLVSALDEIAYILNLRGKDVHCNPVFVAYLLIDKNECSLFILDGKINFSLLEILKKDGINCFHYQKFQDRLKIIKENEKIWIDASTLNAKITFSLIKGSLIQSPSPIMTMKACKNEVEMQHIRRAMEKDGVAFPPHFCNPSSS